MLLLQNPMNSMYEPDYGAASGGGSWWLLVVLLILYGAGFWAILAGPLRFWAEENKGAAYALVTLVPGIAVLGLSLLGS